MYTVFLAGGIASGKSTVARELERLGATRIDLDQLSREVLAAGSPCLAEVTSAFGEELLDPVTGELNRSLLASRVFGSKELLARLEQIELPTYDASLEESLMTWRYRLSLALSWRHTCWPRHSPSLA